MTARRWGRRSRSFEFGFGLEEGTFLLLIYIDSSTLECLVWSFSTYQRRIEIREGAVALKAAHCVLIKHFKSFLFFNGITVRCSSSSSSLVVWLSLAKAFLMGRVFIRGNLETPPILPSPPQSSFLTLPWIPILLLLFWVGGWLVGGVFADGII